MDMETSQGKSKKEFGANTIYLTCGVAIFLTSAIEALQNGNGYLWLRMLAVSIVALFVFSPLVVIRKPVIGSGIGALMSAVALSVYLPAVIWGAYSAIGVTVQVKPSVSAYLFLGLLVFFFIFSLMYLCVGWRRKFG